ncbi:antibiotic biosynthesis monooxygenase [Aeribacillus sp. FSL K6-8210]|uniref:antibiotic biosynthesis monooxygenase n=1 Tax=Aeribacillus sp. FSL K6-8210 TaxID=2954683 RepID=UPI0030D365EF
MYIVTNSIRVKKGYSGKLVERFKIRKGIEKFPGFIRLDLLVTDGLKDYDEVRVYTTWENKDSFEGWFHSDVFQKAHENRKQHDYVIGNQVSFHELAYSYVKEDERAVENL